MPAVCLETFFSYHYKSKSMPTTNFVIYSTTTPFYSLYHTYLVQDLYRVLERVNLLYNHPLLFTLSYIPGTRLI